MTRFTFEKRLLKKLHGIRELSQQFFKDNPEYDCGGDGYVSMAVFKDCVSGNTSPHRDDHVSVFEEVRG